MGKGKTISTGDSTLDAGLGALRGIRKSMSKERMADYGVTLSALSAAQKNLQKQLGTYQKELTGTNASVNTKLTSLTKKAKANQKAVALSQAQTVNRYGSALGASTASQYGQARAQATAGVLQTRGNQMMGSGITKAGNTAIGIAQAGARAQKSAAEYAMNQALQQRTIMDNQTLAQFAGQLYSQATAFEYWKKQQEYVADQAQQTALKGVAGSMADVSGANYDAYQYMQAHPDAKVSEIVNAVTGDDSNYVLDDNAKAILTQSISNMKTEQYPPGQDVPGQALVNAYGSAYGEVQGYDQIDWTGGVSAATLARQEYYLSHQDEFPWLFGGGSTVYDDTQVYTAATNTGGPTPPSTGQSTYGLPVH